MTQALRSLHEKKVLHRDLKCANIFVTLEGMFKLGDLNVSKVLKKDMARTQTGTPYYASPEVWKDKPYGVKSDMWSLGCVLYEMAALKPPFTATDLPGLYKKICTGYFQRIPAVYSNDLAKVISSLLKLNPNERPNTIELLQNPLVHKYYKGEIDIAAEAEEDDFLLKTLKVNHANLRSIKQILPKANYEG
jgi:NIMA (never in mitosis gene a)-related kinase 1/4/5